MSTLPRLLVMIGSGETAEAMTRVQRTVIGRLVAGHGGAPVPGVVIDTPYRFQENAADLSGTLLDYFRRRLGIVATLTSVRAADDPVTRAAALETIREAQFVFSGPGSPSYALRQWQGTGLAELLTAKLDVGGVVVFASAAALTLGRLVVPVYEIYKGGADPYWLPGLDVLGALGMGAAVVPHYDNQDGQGHDTRFCFLGERRLQALEEQAPDTYVLGIDEHTALVLDLDAERAQVQGRGAVTVRERGTSTVFASGSDFALDELRRRTGHGSAPQPVASDRPAAEGDLVRRVVELERVASEQGRAATLVEPLVEALLEVRSGARARGDYALADSIRARLTALGIELTDAADGATGYRLRG